MPLDTILDRAGDDASVWAVTPNGNRATRKAIVLGKLELEGHVLLQTGLLAGERLILPPHDGLAEGRRIRIFNTES